MAKNTTLNAATTSNATKIKFHYIKSNFFRVIHVDGVFGGVTPSADIFLALFSQRPPLPKMTVQAVLPDGNLGEEIMTERDSKEGIVREAEIGVNLDLAAAKALHVWLGERIELLEKTQDSAMKKNEKLESRK